MERPKHDLPPATVQDGIVGRLGEYQSRPALVLFVESQAPGHAGDQPPYLTYPGAVVEREQDRFCRQRAYFHRAIMIRVPTPGVDSIVKSLTRRRAPPSPRPSPCPLV